MCPNIRCDRVNFFFLEELNTPKDICVYFLYTWLKLEKKLTGTKKLDTVWKGKSSYYDRLSLHSSLLQFVPILSDAMSLVTLTVRCSLY
jgi:hypothetical protein